MRTPYLNKNVNSFVFSKDTNTFSGYSNVLGWYGDTRDIKLHNTANSTNRLFLYKGNIIDTEDYLWESECGIKLIIKK